MSDWTLVFLSYIAMLSLGIVLGVNIGEVYVYRT